MLAGVPGVTALFDDLCLRWLREADVLYQQQGAIVPTLVVLPRDVTADEVAIRVEGLRGNLLDRADAILADLRPTVAPYDPAGLVFLADVRDGAAVYVTLGHPDLRRAMGLRVVPGEPRSLTRADDDPPVGHFAWLDALLTIAP